jgi:hypothetical protein
MSRNGSGSYIPPASTWNPAIDGTVISADDWNALLADMAAALTGSIASDGQTPTSAAIPFANGVYISSGDLATPSLAFVGDVNTGIYRPAADQMALVCGGVAVLTATASGVTFGSLSVTTLLTGNGTVGAPAIAATADTNTGLYFPAADEVGLVTGGVARLLGTGTGVGVTGNLSASGNLAITGTTALTGAVTITAAATLNDALTVAGVATFNGNTVIGNADTDTLTVNAVATFTADTILDDTAPTSTRSAGFRGAPVETQDVAYSFTLPDAGQTIRHTSGSAHAWTIEPDATTNFPIGTTIVVRNIGTGAVTITRGSGVVLRIGGTSTDSNKTLAQWGLATLLKEAADTWVISGAGVT